MNPDQVRELLRAEPFEPFNIRLTSGNALLVSDPNSVALMNNRLFIAFPDGEHWAFCPYLHIAALESVGNGRQ
jgi:hypothetical protein